MPERREARRLHLAGELLLALQVGHEEAAALGREAEVVDRQHAQRRLTLARIGLSDGIEGLLGDAEVGDLDRHDAALAPHEEHERRQHRRDLERARAGLAIDRGQLRAVG